MMNGWQIAGCVAGYLFCACLWAGYTANARTSQGKVCDDFTCVFLGLFWPFTAPWWLGSDWAKQARTRQEEAERMKAAAKKALGEVME